MAPPALSLPLNAIRNLLSAKHGEALIAPLLAIAFLFAMVWDDLETSFSAAIASMQTDANAGSVVLSFTHAGSSAPAIPSWFFWSISMQIVRRANWKARWHYLVSSLQ